MGRVIGIVIKKNEFELTSVVLVIYGCLPCTWLHLLYHHRNPVRRIFFITPPLLQMCEWFKES